MGYKRFRLGIIWRIVVLLSVWTFYCYSVFKAGWIFLSVLLVIISFAVILELVFFVARIHREMNQCLQSILANDFSIYFPDQVRSGNEDIRTTSNAIIARFKELQLDKERLLSLTNKVMENLHDVLICFVGKYEFWIYDGEEHRGWEMK